MTGESNDIIENEDRYLTLKLGDLTYGISIRDVLEIIGIGSITKVPGMPEYVIGLTNMRGKVIPVIDLRLRLHKARREYDDRTCCVVCAKDDTEIGLIVDRAESVVEINGKDIVDVPAGKLENEKEFLFGLGKRKGEIQLLLDIDQLIK